ncbi:MFS transporter [Amycolatopsis sp. cg9]|uniref:MFS transporter n=1 Tax=Amycolatopsis sp. cg9 TaxID=3238801 RepID=UPI003525A682
MTSIHPATTGTEAGRKTPARAAVASLLGSALEYYDYMLYAAAAALVFPHVFFPSVAPASAVLLSFATYGVSYVARPFGAFIFGTIGDKLGRKTLLQLTVLMMGVATLAIGLLPSYAQIGVAAPILLVALRIVQGLSTAAEAPGGYALTIEHAPEDRRSFFSSWTMSGVQGGQALASLAFLPVAALPKESLYSWGWRIPFLLSVVVIIATIVIRRTLPETPEFADRKAKGTTASFPAKDVLKHQWRDVLRVLFCSFYASVSSLATVFGLSFATSDAVGVSSAVMLWAVLIANIIAVPAQPFWGRVADRIGRKPVFIGGAVASAALLFAYFGVINSGSVPLIIVLAVLLLGVFYSAPNGVSPALYGEMFNSKVRTIGMAVGMQLGLVLYGFAPAIGQSLKGSDAHNWLPIAVLGAVAAGLAAISAATARETYRTPLAEVGRTWGKDA